MKQNPQRTATEIANALGLESASVSSRLTKLRRTHGFRATTQSGARGAEYSATE